MIARASLLTILVLLLAAFAGSIAFYPRLPATVPVHWNIYGEPDGFGSRWIALLLGPAIMLALLLLAVLLPRLGPFRQNFAAFRTTYGRILVALFAGLLGVHLIVLLKSSGAGLPIGSALAVVLGLMFACVGNWLGKVRRNFYVGIRTPWTLANNVVWERTHRAGARLFTAYGLLVCVAGLVLSQPATFIVVIAGALLIVVWSLVYSCVLYRRLGNVDDVTSA